MDEPLAVALKFGFLAVLYLFLLWVVRSAMRDLARYEGTAAAAEPVEPARARGGASAAPPTCARASRRGCTWWRRWGTSRARPSTSATGATFGPLRQRRHPRGRPVRFVRRTRASSRGGEFMYLEDMGSTNGTYLNGRQVKTAERLKMADTIRIGDSEYRYEE